LLGPVGEPILDFHYESNWYTITDGAGFSLVVVDSGAAISAWGLAQNWRPSSESGGSPGAVDPALPVALAIISPAGVNTLSLAWPASAGGFNLYSADTLGPLAPWFPVTNTPVLLNNEWVVTLSPLTNRASFYRLQSATGP